jgi:hypothetical protein
MTETVHFGFSYTIPMDDDGYEWDVDLTLCGVKEGCTTTCFSDVTCEACQKAILFGAKIIETNMQAKKE